MKCFGLRRPERGKERSIWTDVNRRRAGCTAPGPTTSIRRPARSFRVPRSSALPCARTRSSPRGRFGWPSWPGRARPSQRARGRAAPVQRPGVGRGPRTPSAIATRRRSPGRAARERGTASARSRTARLGVARTTHSRTNRRAISRTRTRCRAGRPDPGTFSFLARRSFVESARDDQGVGHYSVSLWGTRTTRGALAGRSPGFRIRSGAWVTGSTS